MQLNASGTAFREVPAVVSAAWDAHCRNALSCAVPCAQARDIHDNLGKAVDAILTRLKELGAQIDERQVWDGIVRDSVPLALLPCQRIAGPACGDHTLQVSTHMAAVGEHSSRGAHGGRG
jgi:hypothetical protein